MFDINDFIDVSIQDISLKKKTDKKGKINLASNELVSNELTNLQKQYHMLSRKECNNTYPYYPRKRQEIANLLSVESEKVEFFAGSDSAIYFLLTSLSKKVEKLIIQYPNYENYFSYSKINKIESISWKLDIDNLEFHIEELEDLLNDQPKKPLGVIISNPNGFTGKLFPLQIVEYLSKMTNEKDCLLIIDLAYLLFSKQSIEDYHKIVDKYSNVILVNTLSKSHGLAGERFGYIYGHSKYINYIRQWNGINSISESTYNLVKYYLKNEYILKKLRNKVIQNRDTLFKKNITNFQNKIYSSEANFLLIEHENKNKKEKFIQNFFDSGFVIRNLNNIEMMHSYSRITIPADDYLNIFDSLL